MDTIIIINILRLIIAVANVYLFVMFATAILSLLSVFGVINVFDSSTAMSRLYFSLRSFLAPVTNFISRFIPQVGMLDLSFMVLLLILWIIKDISYYWIERIQASSFMF